VPATAVDRDGAIAKKAKLIHFYRALQRDGRDDAARWKELMRRTAAGIRVIGPNCMGVHYPKAKISFDPDLPRTMGSVGVLSQSGSHAFRIIGKGGERGLGFSKVISYGNAMDLNESDFLEHFAQDPETEVIGAYIEGVRVALLPGAAGRRRREAGRHSQGRADERRALRRRLAHRIARERGRRLARGSATGRCARSGVPQ
jgi:hypothetical protein